MIHMGILKFNPPTSYKELSTSGSDLKISKLLLGLGNKIEKDKSAVPDLLTLDDL